MRVLAETLHAGILEVAERHRLPTSPAAIIAALGALSRDYNERGHTRSTKESLSARLSFSLPRDAPKSMMALRELCATRAIPQRRPLRVLDLGAGLGATTAGLLLALERWGIEGAVDAVLVDEDESALAIAKDAVPLFAGGRAVSVSAHRSKLPFDPGRAPLDRRYDLVLLGQVLSELDLEADGDARADRHAAWIERLLDGVLEPDGALVVIEPALRDRSRHLHRVRSRLADRVFAPCLHRSACPMLASERDWCHEDRPIDLPAFAEKLARGAGLRWQGLTFAYLVLRRDGRELARELGGADLHRLVASPRITKGKRELVLCRPDEPRRVIRLDRDGAKRDAIESAARGDVLRVKISEAARIDRAASEAAALPVDALLPEP